MAWESTWECTKVLKESAPLFPSKVCPITSCDRSRPDEMSLNSDPLRTRSRHVKRARILRSWPLWNPDRECPRRQRCLYASQFRGQELARIRALHCRTRLSLSLCTSLMSAVIGPDSNQDDRYFYHVKGSERLARKPQQTVSPQAHPLPQGRQASYQVP